MTSPFETSTLFIRDIESHMHMRAAEQLQKEVWGLPDLDVVPLTHLVAVKATGGVFVGAFDRETLVGFVYGFVGYESGRMVHHSHMLAVKPAYRNLNLGYKLKLAQRERVLTQGVTLVTWTFDPLQSLNAHFNFGKLGVFADRYLMNFYGEDATSFLHRNGTDRLWVTWPLTSPRVCERLDQTNPKKPDVDTRFNGIVPLVQIAVDDSPRRNSLAEGFSAENALIEIPMDINALEKGNRELAVEWRQSTRFAFTQAIEAGYLVSDFYRQNRADKNVGVYLLSRSGSKSI